MNYACCQLVGASNHQGYFDQSTGNERECVTHHTEPTLFTLQGMQLPEQIGPSMLDRIVFGFSEPPMDKKQRPVFLIVNNEYEDLTREVQTELLFPELDCPKIIQFAPKRSLVYLDYGVHDIFRDVPEIARIAKKLESVGIYVVGQLVQFSEAQLLAFPFVTENALVTMKKELEIVELKFGMRIRKWTDGMKGILRFLP